LSSCASPHPIVSSDRTTRQELLLLRSDPVRVYQGMGLRNPTAFSLKANRDPSDRPTGSSQGRTSSPGSWSLHATHAMGAESPPPGSPRWILMTHLREIINQRRANLPVFRTLSLVILQGSRGGSVPLEAHDFFFPTRFHGLSGTNLRWLVEIPDQCLSFHLLLPGNNRLKEITEPADQLTDKTECLLA